MLKEAALGRLADSKAETSRPVSFYVGWDKELPIS